MSNPTESGGFPLMNNTCRHCGLEIRTGEAGVAPWIHVIGFYQCPGLWGAGWLAEPQALEPFGVGNE